jgi:chitinase
VSTVAKRLRTVLVIPAIVLALASCGGGGQGDDGPDSGSPPTTPTPSPGTVDTTAPTVPQGVTATAQTPTQVLVSWSASTDAGTGVAGYRVFRNGDGTPIATVQTLTYTDGSVAANTAYSYTIVAFDGASPANVSAPSAAVSATTPPMPPQPDTTPPSTPAQLRATALSTSEIGLEWNASTDSGMGVAGYRIYRDGNATPIAAVQTTSFTDSGLAAGTRYTYTVLGYDGATPANESALSNSASATTRTTPPIDVTPPSVPAGVTATAQSTTSIRVTWTASTDASGISGYRIFRDGGAQPIATVQTTEYTDTNLAPNTTYTYTVSARDDAVVPNESARSAPASATTLSDAPPPDTTPPTVPTGLQASAQGTSTIALQWTASTDAGSGVAGYRIYRDGSATPLASVTTTNYTDTGLAAGTTYSYAVRAFDAAAPANESALSAAASATTQAQPPPVDVTPPSVPANVTATAQSTSSILVSWVASTDASGISAYRVFRDGGATPVATVQGTTFTDTNLTANTTYSYTVTAVDGAPVANESAPSAPASATTNADPPGDTTPPSVPTNVSAVPQSASQILVSWTASTDASGIAGYEVLREGVAEPIAFVQTTSYTDDSLSAGTTYTYRVRAVDGATPANRSADSAPATATTDSQPPLDFTPPTVPTNVRADVGGGGNEVRVRWDASTDASGISGYRVFRNGGATPIATVQNRDFRDREVQPSTTYTYTVQAVDGALFPNVSAHSAPASATTPP